MRHILHGFTMHTGGLDYGIDTEEIELPFPVPVTQEYGPGGMDLKVNQPHMQLEALEVKIKMSGYNTDIMRQMALAPGRTKIVTFRGAVLPEATGVYIPHVCVVQGAINGDSRDRWQRGEKAGFEFLMNGVIYYRYDAADTVVHEIQAWPPKRIIDGIDQLQVNNFAQAMGY